MEPHFHIFKLESQTTTHKTVIHCSIVLETPKAIAKVEKMCEQLETPSFEEHGGNKQPPNPTWHLHVA